MHEQLKSASVDYKTVEQTTEGEGMAEGSGAERDWNERVIEEFRENGGKVGGPFEGAPLLLLHHVGARSGVSRVSPLVYQAVDGAYAIFASNAGRDTHPSWYHNLLAQPRTEIEVGTEAIGAIARVADGEERDAIWERQKQAAPQFAEYEAGTERRIPVVVMEPAEADG